MLKWDGVVFYQGKITKLNKKGVLMMNKKILLSSVLALTISLAPISSAKAMDFQIGPPGPRDDNGSPTSPYNRAQRIAISINSEDSVKVGEPIRFDSDFDRSNLRIHESDTISYSWDLGEETTRSTRGTTKVFNEPGTYTVKLKININARPGCYQEGSTLKYFGETTKTIIVE